MGKRSDYERVERDFYPTPIEAVIPLMTHLPKEFTFSEPCAGDGRLVDHIETLGGDGVTCTHKSDIEPNGESITQMNVFDYKVRNEKLVITNPPWDRKLLHPIIDHFSRQAPTWLLFDANWMFTKQAKDYLPWCKKIVTIGRVKWIEGSKGAGKDDSCWYLFHDDGVRTPTLFYGK
tara:strand:- start:2909 stop:3436 length:528 start_codon:yes stop_codon:yes gene_type:complete